MAAATLFAILNFALCPYKEDLLARTIGSCFEQYRSCVLRWLYYRTRSDGLFHMLTCFNLKPGETIESFRDSLAELTVHLKEKELVKTVGPIGLRQRDTIMDTDDERDHQYFFIMSFTDREQCDRSVEYMYQKLEPVESLHKRTYKKIDDPIFISWLDIC